MRQFRRCCRPTAKTRLAAFELIGQALGARGEFSAEDRKRMNEVARLFGVDAGSPASPNLALVPSTGATAKPKSHEAALISGADRVRNG